MPFKDILETLITDEADRNALAGYVAKYPDLDKLPSLREHEQRQTQIANLTTQATTLKSELNQWSEFRDNHWDYENHKTKEQLAAETQLAEVNQQLEALKAAQGTEMTFDDVKTNLEKAGYAPVSELEKRFVDQKKVEDRFNRQGVAIETMYGKLTPWQTEYRMEFGRPMTNFQEFVNYAASDAERLKDPQKAYETFVAAERREVAAAKERQLLADERAKFEADQKEWQNRTTHQANLTDQGGNMGHFQRTILAKQGGEKVPDKATIGDLSQAAKAYSAWKNGNLTGSVQ